MFNLLLTKVLRKPCIELLNSEILKVKCMIFTLIKKKINLVVWKYLQSVFTAHKIKNNTELMFSFCTDNFYL